MDSGMYRVECLNPDGRCMLRAEAVKAETLLEAVRKFVEQLPAERAGSKIVITYNKQQAGEEKQ